MKKTLITLSVILLLVSCEKQGRPLTEDSEYWGTYLSALGDTLYVSEGSGIYTQFQYSPKDEPTHRILFDSVKVHTDNTFTDNEQVYLFGYYQNVGTGNFSTNTVYFNFNVGGGTLIYNGVK